MFTLVTFTCPEKVEMECLVALGQIAIDRVRTTDDVGLLGPHCLGVVLPETSAGGAAAAWPTTFARSSPRNGQGHSATCTSIRPGASLRRTTTKARASIAATGGPSGGGELAPVGADEDDPRAAQAIQFFFVQTMPRWKRAIDLCGSVTAADHLVAAAAGGGLGHQVDVTRASVLHANAWRVGRSSVQDLQVSHDVR